MTSPPVEEVKKSIVMTMSVSPSVSVCPGAYLRNYRSDLHHNYFYARYLVSGSVLRWWRSIYYVLSVLWMTS